MDNLLAEATDQGLTDSFFVHYAPNLGRGADGKEVMWLSDEQASGTTDFQFMLRGAVKEAGGVSITEPLCASTHGHLSSGGGLQRATSPP